MFSPTLVLQHLSGRHNIHKIRLCHTMLPLTYECVMPKPLKLAVRIQLIKAIIATSFTNKAKHANKSCSINQQKMRTKTNVISPKVSASSQTIKLSSKKSQKRKKLVEEKFNFRMIYQFLIYALGLHMKFPHLS